MRQFLLAALGSFGWALVCNAALNLLQTGGNFRRLMRVDLGDAPLVFLLSSVALWLLLLLLIALTGRFYVSCAVFLVALGVLGYANHEKLRIRNEPVVPSDFGFAGQTGFMTDMVGAWTLAVAVALMVLVLGLALVAGRVSRRAFPRPARRTDPGAWRAWMVARGVIVLTGALVVVQLAQFNQPGNVARALYDKTGITWAYWFQRNNYWRNGPVAGFLYNMPTTAMEVPAGYSEEEMSRVAARYQRVADRMNARATRSLGDLNVVFVLSEAFSDPSQIDGVTLERDPIPFTRRLMDSTTSGSLLTQHYGGGTANMEFESLTGQSLSQFLPQSDTPYSMTVAHQSSYPSIVGYLKALSHRAVAIHPYHPGMYDRSAAYEALGFDDFVTEADLDSPTRIDNNRFIADSAAFAEVMKQLRGSPGPDLLNVVTMQNHYPNDHSYHDPLKVSGVDSDIVSDLGNYARGLEYSDAALASFIRELRSFDEPTAVVFYGDHQPAIWRDDPRISANVEEMYRTPFFLWSNIQRLPREEIPLTSAIYFAPMLFRAMGLELPPLYALLSQLQRHVGAMETGRYFSPSGAPIHPQQDPVAERLLRDYRLVQYDLSIGKRYALSEMFPQ